ncbi:right-handed parallel beta-helix repeat-containing protein [Celerinatantimonas yamalensis]|uniref:Exopolygalacturonate lyase n=1 Tax=Celerinatantimonas yamalensis TaxID=559956 RepID=A0ABW9G886_9GAMM
MKKNYGLVLNACASALLLMYSANSVAQSREWVPITFGQSTDLNFGSTILPNKIGTNQVTHDGKQVTQAGPLLDHFTIESRGGKLANSHEGGTFYYTVLPTSENFTLSADVTLEQLGPETGATPNRQEGAGLIVRDIIGPARANPQPLGHEEFPSSSNMVMNLLRSHSRSNDNQANANASFRRGVRAPWGSPHNLLKRHDYVEGLVHDTNHTYHMTLQRTDKDFVVGIQQPGQTEVKYTIKNAPANLVSIQDKTHQYVGFFAARNAKVKIQNVTLLTSQAHTLQTPAYQAPAIQMLVEVASPAITTVHDYVVQAVANYDGEYQVIQDGHPLGNAVAVKAGELLSVPAQVEAKSDFKLMFTRAGQTQVSTQRQWQVTYQSGLADPYDIYVSPDGKATNAGSRKSPLDIETAIKLLPQGGEIHLTSGKYPGITLDKSLSGTPTQPKRLVGEGDVSFTGMVHVKADNWQLLNFEVVGERLIINGSHNWIDHVVVHEAPDTGIQVTSKRGIGRALWASYNLITNSESYNNMDKSQINADGFAVKMRVGDGNTLVNCVSHHNVDDGFDLFNKVEDGPDGAVKIINSIAFNNGQTFHMKNMKGGHRGNGFKLGGEGLPVAHTLVHSLSFNNHMDGITDNFNPGPLTIMDNIAINNQRFNYILRNNPYGKILRRNYLSQNISMHLDKGKHYDDAVHGDISSSNEFYINGKNTVDLNAKVKSEIEKVVNEVVVNEKQASKQIQELKRILNKN